MALPSRGLIALLVVNFGSSAMMRVCDPMLPALAREFGVTTGQAALTISAYAVAYGLMQLAFGPLGDRFGKRRVIGSAALACVAGNLLALAAISLDMLVAARVLGGATAAGIVALVLAWVGDTVPYERRQPVLARFLTASLAGMIAGQWVSGVLTEHLGWRSVFAALAVLFAAGGLVVVRDPDVRAEARRAGGARNPLHDYAQVLSVPWARWMLAIVTLEGAFAFGGLAFLPAFLVHEYGLGLSAAAGVVALYGVGGFVYSFAARPLLGRLGEAGLAFMGGALLTLAWLALAFDHHWVLAMPATAAAGLGFYTLHGTMQTHATQMAPAVRGTAVGLFAAGLFLGISIGVAVASMVVDRAGTRPVFLACGLGLAAVGAAFAFSLRRRAALAGLPHTRSAPGAS